MKRIKSDRVLRFAIGSNLCDDRTFWFEASGGRGWYYVLDLLEGGPHETDPKKGWFRKKKTAQAAVDKLNAADTGEYAELSNGYVERAQEINLMSKTVSHISKQERSR